jgi:hypothetical protein
VKNYSSLGEKLFINRIHELRATPCHTLHKITNSLRSDCSRRQWAGGEERVCASSLKLFFNASLSIFFERIAPGVLFHGPQYFAVTSRLCVVGSTFTGCSLILRLSFLVDRLHAFVPDNV